MANLPQTSLVLWVCWFVTAESLGFTSYPPAYLSPDAQGENLLIGANFASAASGYFDRTTNLYRAVSLTQQIKYYKAYQSKVVNITENAKAWDIFSGTIYLLRARSSDFVQNYYINPLLNGVYSPDQFSDILIRSFETFVQGKMTLKLPKASRIGTLHLYQPSD